jgi:hypothetical protein
MTGILSSIFSRRQSDLVFVKIRKVSENNIDPASRTDSAIPEQVCPVGAGLVRSAVRGRWRLGKLVPADGLTRQPDCAWFQFFDAARNMF